MTESTERDHSAEQLEDVLAQRYRQPRGVEQFGIEAVPEAKREVRWYDLFAIVVNFLVNPGTVLVAGLAVAAGLSFWGALAVEVLGITLAFTIYVIMATVGVDYGVPGQVATRMAYGLRGSKWIPSLVRTVASIYWFAFQTIAGALGITAVVRELWGVQLSVSLVSVVFAVLQVLVATVGYNSLKVLSRFAFPVKLIITGYLIYMLMTFDDPAFSPGAVFGWGGTVGWEWALVALWINTVASAWYSMVTDAADFCRYSRTRVDMWIGTLGAAVIGTAIATALGAYAVAATRAQNGDAWDVLATIAGGPALIAILVVIVLDNWTINVLNLYTGGLSVVNILTRLGRFWATLAVSALGVLLSVFPALTNQYSGFMTAMGNVFAPIAGVLIADYVLVKRMRIDVPALFDRTGPYWYWQGFNWVAVAWTAVGFGIYYLAPTEWIKNLVTTIVVIIGYTITVRVLSARSAVARDAGRPAPADVHLDAEELDRRLAAEHS
jgi:NCS1 nucleoside transporter family